MLKCAIGSCRSGLSPKNLNSSNVNGKYLMDSNKSLNLNAVLPLKFQYSKYELTSIIEHVGASSYTFNDAVHLFSLLGYLSFASGVHFFGVHT